jgi:hypothetical protein
LILNLFFFPTKSLIKKLALVTQNIQSSRT